MLGKKHSMIKLFGKNIQLGSNLSGDMSISERTEPCFAVIADSDDLSTSSKQSMNRGYEESSTTEPIITNQEEEKSSSTQTSPYSTLSINPPKTPSNDKDNISQHLSQNEDHTDQTSTTTTHSQDQNPPRKPIETLPCPRCCSMSTKFCYFNNYNVNQPRHFCKNCQRYWTAGGAMRNVPVGAGRRKSQKTSAFHYHRDHPQLRPNGGDSLDSKSLALSLKLMQKQQSYTPNGFHLLEFTRAKNSGFLVSSPALGKHSRDETQLESSITCYEEHSEQRKTEILRGVLCSEWDNNVMSNKFGSSNWRKGFFGGLHHSKCPDHGDQ